MSERGEASEGGFQRIESICDAFLSQLRAGGSPDLQQIVVDHPKLAPDLENRLKLLEAVFLAAKSSGIFSANDPAGSGQSDAEDFRLRQSSVHQKGGTSPSRNLFRDRAKRISCPHCGNVVQLVTSAKATSAKAEATCASCGSEVPFDPNVTATDLQQELPVEIGRFQVIRLLGEGAFGSVYLAYDPQLRRQIAIKVPRSGYFQTSSEEQRFFREAQSAAKLHHSNIVPVHEISQESQTPFIVSEYISGVTMNDLASTGLLTFREIVELMTQVCDAIGHAHNNGVIHRDLKPSNILVDDNRTPWVADFGLARRDDAEITMTMDGMVLGTPAYMSPEQAAGIHQKVDARSDIYSLGVILFKLLARELPFSGTRRMLLHQVIHDEPRSPRKFNDNIPRDLETITLKALNKSPGERFQTAEELKAELQRWLSGEPILSRPIGVSVRFWKWCKRYPLVAGLCASIAGLLLAGAIFAWYKAIREANLRRIADDNAAVATREKEESESLLHEIYHSNAGDALKSNHLVEAGYWYSKALAIKDRPADRSRLKILFERIPKLKAVLPVDGDVKTLALSGNDRRVAVGTAKGKVLVFDVETQELLFETSTLDSFPVYQLEFVLSGSHVLFRHSQSNSQVWNIEKKRLVQELENSAWLGRVAVDMTGDIVATASADDRLELHHLGKGEVVGDVSVEGQIDLVRFLDSGNLLVRSVIEKGEDLSHQLQLVGASDGKPVWTKSFPFDLRIDGPTKGRIATIQKDKIIAVWDAESGSQIGTTVESSEVIGSSWFSEDASQFLFHSRDRRLDIIRFEDSKSVVDSIVLDFRPGRLKANHNSLVAAATSQAREVRFLDKAHWMESISRLSTSRKQPSIEFGSTGSVVAIEGDAHVQVWDLAAGLPDYFEFRHEDASRNGLFSPDGSRCYTTGLDGKAYIWDTGSGQQLGDVMRHDGGIAECTISPNGQLFATVGFDMQAKVWDAITGEQVGGSLPHPSEVLELAFSPDNKLLMTGGKFGECLCWEVSSDPNAEPKPLFTVKHKSMVRRIEFEPTGKFVATAALDGFVRFWDPKTGNPVASIKHSDEVLDCSFSPNGEMMVTSGQDQKVKIWAVDGAKLLFSFDTESEFRDVMFVDNDLVKATGAGTVFWKRSDAAFRELARFSHPLLVAPGSSDFDAGNGHVASAGGIVDLKKYGAGAVALWSLEDQQLLSPPLKHDALVRRVHFSPSGNQVLSNSMDGTARLWNLDSPHSKEMIIAFFEAIYPVLDPESADGNKVEDLEKVRSVLEEYPSLFSVSKRQRERWKGSRLQKATAVPQNAENGTD